MSIILALDLAVKTGFAVGKAGDCPRSGWTALKDKAQPRQIAFNNLICWLDVRLRNDRPSLIVKEAAFPLQAYRDKANSEARVRMDYGLHAIVEGMASRFSIKVEDVHPSTVRKHFVGTGRMGERELTKGMVVNRCHV